MEVCCRSKQRCVREDGFEPSGNICGQNDHCILYVVGRWRVASVTGQSLNIKSLKTTRHQFETGRSFATSQ
jgi:hypothetical protein